jgi:hypothetical protein
VCALQLRILRLKAEAVADKIAAFIADIENQLNWIMQLPWSASTLEQRRSDGLRLLRLSAAITEVSQLDPSGKCRALDLGEHVRFLDGPKAFEVLARRMDACGGLSATLLLNIQRKKGDTTETDQLVRRFADRFWKTEWPGSVRPRVYYDPRALKPSGPGGVLHAKAAVADDEAVFVTSDDDGASSRLPSSLFQPLG